MRAEAIETIQGIADRVLDATTFELEGRIVRLWGCNPPRGTTVEANAAADALTALIGNQPLACIEIERAAGQTIARCFVQQYDLCAALVRHGHAEDALGVYAPEEALARKSKGVLQ